jgi:hypothetical protein
MKLYSYCLRVDDGAAPNPYWDTCTLAICKPVIRRKAAVGDWVVGLGSKNSPIGDISTRVVYAMRVTKILSMKEYDTFCGRALTEKIPDWTSSDFRRRVGDCIYDFSRHGKPSIRRSVHNKANRKTDLSGLNVLLSDHFYYFGDRPLCLPEYLLPITHPTQGHKSRFNKRYASRFVSWIENAGRPKNSLLGQPQLRKKLVLCAPEERRKYCSTQNSKED